MRDRLLSVWTGIRDKWNALERKQKIRLAAVIGLLLLTIGVTVYLLARPKYVELESNLNYSEMTALTDVLEEKGIPYRKTNGGRRLLVREKDASNALFEITNPNIGLPSTFSFSDAAASIGMSTPGRVADEAMIKYYEDKVASSLIGREGITNATVKVSLPKETNFWIDQEQTGTASVAVTSTRQLSVDDGQWIAAFVAASFRNLEKENVYVIDGQGRTLYGGVDANSLESATGYRQEFENVISRNMAENVKNLLSPMGDIVVAPQLTFDYSQMSQETREYFNPRGEEEATGYVTDLNEEKSSGTSVANDAEPGIGTNNLETPTYQTQNGELQNVDYSSNQRRFAYNETTTVTSTDNFGKLVPEKSSIAVRVMRTTVLSEENATEEQLNGLTWAQFKEANQAPRVSVAQDEIVQSVRTAANVGTVNVLIYDGYRFIDREVTPIPWQTIILFIILGILLILIAYALIRRTQTDEVTEIEPELSVEDLLVSTKMEEEKEKELKSIQELQEIEFQEDSEIKKQIAKFVEERPEAVAQLLRNWINEDWE